MNISQTRLRIGAVLGTIGTIVVLAASAQAAAPKPAGMSQPEYALMIRSEALNTLYGLDGNVVLGASAQAATSKPAGMSQPEYALMIRSEALNTLYGLNRTSQPTLVVEQPIRSGNGFDWGDFGMGAAAMLGLVLLSGGLVAGAYLGRKIGVRPRPGT